MGLRPRRAVGTAFAKNRRSAPSPASPPASTPTPAANGVRSTDTTDDPDHRPTPPQRLAKLAALRGLLQRGAPHLARCRQPDPRTLPRRQSSLDDFARAFFGVNDRDWGELTYNFDDIVHTLNEVQPNDWAAFLHARLDQVSDHAPLDGFTRGGYQLVYTDTPTEWFKANEKSRKITDLTYSGGFVLGKEGEITDVAWDGPAFNAGLTVGTKLIAVNGRALDTDQLKAAIKAKKSPLSLLVKTGDIYRTIDLNYNGGLRYPRLEKIATGPASLDELLAPKT